MESIVFKEIEIKDGAYGRVLTLDCEWTDNFIDLIERENIQELVLQRSHRFPRESLDFLARISWLKSFEIHDMVIDDISGIHNLAELRSLGMFDYSRAPIDFKSFPKLDFCHMEFSKNRRSVAECRGLTGLSVQHFSYKDLSCFSSLTELTTLDVFQGSLGDISKIGDFRLLHRVTLALLRNLTDISSLSNLAHLDELDLEGCKNFHDLSPLADCPNLRDLNIANCGRINSLRPLLGCQKLEMLTAYEDSDIVDGDLAVLLELPNLKDVSIKNRKHYNVNRDVLPSILAASTQG